MLTEVKLHFKIISKFYIKRQLSLINVELVIDVCLQEKAQ